jgi:MFS family permease
MSAPIASPGSARAWPAPREARHAVLVLMVAYLFSYVDRQILAMLVGPIKADLALTDTQVSWLHGLAFALCYTLLGVWPVGAWADRGNRRNLIAAGVALWSVMTVLCGRAQSFGALFLARVGVGVGEATLTPSAYSMLADYFPPERRGRALGAFAMGVYFGIGLAIMITGLVVQQVANTPTVTLPLIGEVRSWQVAFLIVGPPGLLVALWMLTVKEPPRSPQPAALAESFRAAIDFLATHARFYGALTLGIACLTLLFNAVAFWTPAFLMRVHGLTPARVAMTYGPLMFVFGALGIYAGGALADLLRRRGRRDAELLVGIGSALALGPVTVFAFQAESATVALTLMAPLLALSSLPFGAASAALQLVTPNRYRARASALYLLVVNLTGIGFGSTAAALVTDFTFRDELRVGDSVSVVAAIAAPLAALTLWGGLRSYRSMQEPKDPRGFQST